ncbi:MAG: methyltransferase domain-containing protein [Caldilinea sp. CFX5]|nr:methyltransferase domain-containing protein [Caldilinea sp. CFX5]
MPCPICGARTRRVFVKDGYPIRECVACRHRSVQMPRRPNHIAEVYGDHYFQAKRDRGRAGYPDYLAEADLLQAHGWQYAELLQRFMPLGTVLDVGAAAGFVLQGLVERGWRGVGLEPNATMSDYGRTQLGLTMVTGTLEDARISATATKGSFDLITMIQVIAHFQDLHRALTHAAALTRDDGFWLIESWDRTSWPARLLGRYGHEYRPPSVLHWFSPTGVKQLAGQFGFVEVARGRPKKRLKGAQAKSLLRYKVQGLPLSALLALIPDVLTIPYPNFDLFWILLQKKPTAWSMFNPKGP